MFVNQTEGSNTMSATIEYYEIIVSCSECDTLNTIRVISEYDVKNGKYETSEPVVGQKCRKCRHEFNCEDIT